MKEQQKSSLCRYIALDIHKHYSVVAGVDRDGEEILNWQPLETLAALRPQKRWRVIPG